MTCRYGSSSPPRFSLAVPSALLLRKRKNRTSSSDEDMIDTIDEIDNMRYTQDSRTSLAFVVTSGK